MTRFCFPEKIKRLAVYRLEFGGNNDYDDNEPRVSPQRDSNPQFQIQSLA